MYNRNSTKIITTIIYFLIITLVCLILYNLFLVLTKSYYSNQTPENSIKVGPIFVEWKY